MLEAVLKMSVGGCVLKMSVEGCVLKMSVGCVYRMTFGGLHTQFLT